MPARPFVPHERDSLIVRGLSILGMDQPGIAGLMGISVDTLAKYFPDEIAIGAMQANAAMAGKLYSDGMAGNTTAQIFWLKCRGKWRERDPEIAPPPGDRVGEPSAESELTAPVVGPRLGGLTLIGPAKTKPVNAKKTNGHAK